ncbi:death domain-associated protein 6 isoform X2 [Trichoplusia ni]|uniref:Death domain-associated protein 6 isoform X2 n=1 Tax=Trichoplusia ni TaxID=7111 RepID=A0A7E5VC28_TRINI|nr:death domain-associated protein 6 isoform X2 [Trichoplusia ni]
MASEDVIELGSSDEDSEPAPKKCKPLPNAMVCIPKKLHEVTIQPARINKNIPPKGIVRGVSIHTTVSIKKLPKPNIVKPQLLNPLSIQRSIRSAMPKVSYKPTAKNPGPSKVLKEPIKILNSYTTLTKLPPSITVKKTSQLTKRPIVILNPPRGQKINEVKKKTINRMRTVATVDLDDDESPVNPGPANPSPVWYIRPEDEKEEKKSCSLEQQNNNEPTTSKMIEITIEDSPIKVVQNKRTCEIGEELAITIEDSPNKPVDKKDSPSGSDDEKQVSKKETPRKKKLEYPAAGDDDKKTMVIEIDIPLEETLNIVNKNSENMESKISNVSDKKTEETSQKVENLEEDKQNPIANTNNEGENEFHTIYQSFIDLCFQLENSEDMRKIVEKKIKGYYRQVPKEFTESEEFIDMVSGKIMAMKACPDKMYLYIKDVVDELNMQRKLAKSHVNAISTEVKSEEPEQISFAEDCEYDMKRQRQIRKLEKTIKKLHRAIQKLESQEVDFDDDDDSVYLLTERYKERMVRVYAKFCQLTNTKMPSEPRIQIDARPGRPSGPAKRLEKWINKRVPIGTPLPFPDFHDVIRCVREANEEDKLCWNEADIMEEARDLFTRCGKKLQRRRQENEWRLAASRISTEVDPAENDEHLKTKLSENRKLAEKKETEIFNKFADRQNQLKLEAVEIGDKEAEESPVESEDDDAADDGVLLENKDNRKDRLKRLLQERSKRISDEKENQPTRESEKHYP